MGPVARGILGATALSIAFLVLFQILWPLKWRLIATWLVVEVIFYITVWLPRYDKFNRQPEHHEPSNHDAMRAWDRFLKYCRDTPGGLDYKAYIKGWFRGAEYHDIKRGNAEEFVAYGFWYRSLAQMQAAGLGYLPGQMVGDLERLWGAKLEPGYNPDVKFLGHLWEPLSVVWCYRPLIFYCSTEGIGRLGRMLLRRWGFTKHYHNGLAYFTLNISKPKPKAAINSSSNNSDSSSDISSSSAAAAASDVDSSAAGNQNTTVADWAKVTPYDISAPDVQTAEQNAAAPADAGRMQFTGPAAASTAAKKDAAADPAAAASDVNKQLDQQRDLLASVPELCSPTGSADWTPFAASSSCGDSLEASVADLPSAGELMVRSSSPAGHNCSNGSVTPPTTQHSRGSSNGESGTSWHSTGLRPAALSVPVLPRPLGAVDSPRAAVAAAAAAAAAGDRGRTMRSFTMQPVRRSALSIAQALPQLAPRTSALLASLPCPLQEVLSVTGLDQCRPGTPMLFLHGVGGLPAYLELVMHLMATQHPVLAVEFKGVSLRLSKVYTADEVADTVVGILDRMNIEQACVVAHSYGTFIASMLLRRYPQRVASVCLVDPVCFGMFMPNLLYNFLYRPLQLRSWNVKSLLDAAKAAARKVASTELHLRATFSRRFYWTDLNLWPEDLPPGSVVILSGKDDLLDAEAVRAMLEQAGHVQVIWNQELTHGAFLLIPEVKAAMLANIKALLAASGNAVAGLAEGLTSLVSHRPAPTHNTARPTPVSCPAKGGDHASQANGPTAQSDGRTGSVLRALSSIRDALPAGKAHCA